MANWYCSREDVKRAGNIHATNKDAQVDRHIESASREIDRDHRRRYIPETKTNLYRWPNRLSAGSKMWLREDLLSVTTLQTKAQDTTPTTISASDFFLEPQDLGPPFDQIQMDLSGNAAFESGDTPQRSISVAGSWGYSDATQRTGTVSSGLDSGTTATTMVCSNGSLIDVGSTLLIGSEQLFVSDRSFNDVGKDLNGALTADDAEVTITLEGSHGVLAGEIIRVDSEQMFVEAVNTNDLTVIRSFNGSVLASHSSSADVFINRTLTVERGGNGTTAATHADATAISKYEAPFDITTHCVAEALAGFVQDEAQWGRTVGAGDGAREFASRDLATRRKSLKAKYQRLREAAI